MDTGFFYAFSLRKTEVTTMMYDVIIVGAGPGGIFSAYELVQKKPGLKIAVFEAGNPLSKRHCPIDGEKVKTCIGCKTCAIMSGFGGAGAFSDGKYNITNDFGGTLYEHIGKKTALDLMKYVDEINVSHGGENTRMFSTAGTKFKKLCIQNKLKLLDASVPTSVTEASRRSAERADIRSYRFTITSSACESASSV